MLSNPNPNISRVRGVHLQVELSEIPLVANAVCGAGAFKAAAVEDCCPALAGITKQMDVSDLPVGLKFLRNWTRKLS